MDLATGSTSGTVTVLIGNGSGGFTPSSGIPYLADQLFSGSATSVAVADLNGDGVPDIAIAVPAANRIAALIGDGSGAFSSAGITSFFLGSQPYALAAGGINRGGLQNLITTFNGTSNVTQSLGVPAVSHTALATAANTTVTTGQSVPMTITVTGPQLDFNPPTGIVTISDGVTVLGRASLTTSPCAFNVSGLGVGSHAIAASYGGDSRTSGSGSNTIVIDVLQAQTISFGALSPVTFGATPAALSATASSGLGVTFNSNSTGVCTVLGTTITVLSPGTCSITATQSGDGTHAAAPPVTQTFLVSPPTPAIASVTPNTIPARSSGTAITIAGSNFISGATVTFTPPNSTPQTITPTQVQAAQLAATIPASYLTTAGTAQISVNNGFNAFSNQTPFLITPAAQTITFNPISNQILGISPFPIAVRSTARLPITVTSSTPTVCKVSASLVMLLNAGTCSLSASQAGTGSYSAAASVTQTFAVNLATPSGSFTASSVTSNGNHATVASGDFNGDGIPDLAIADFVDQTVTVTLGDGAGGFVAQGPIAAGYNPLLPVTGDFNGDGKVDLAWLNGGTGGGFSVMLGDGHGGFASAPASPLVFGTAIDSLVVADFNGDGIQDLASSDSISNTVRVFLGDGAGAFSAASGSPITVGLSPTCIAVGDFNRDGIADLAVADANGSDVRVLLGNGSGGFALAPQQD